jgi:cell division protein FtsQ
MDKRIRDRRRSVNRDRGRRRAGLALIFVLVLIAAVLFFWLRSSDVFAVKQVTVTTPQRVTEEEISRVTAEAVGVSLLSLSIAPIKKALLTLSYVQSVEVYRRFPNTLDVRLVEYEPVARLRAENGTIWLVAEDGRALEKATPPRGSALPLVVPALAVSPVAGEELPDVIVNALSVAALLQNEEIGGKLPAVQQITISSGGTVALALKGGTELRLGDTTGLEHKFTVAIAIIQQCSRDKKQMEYVDVTVPERVAVKPK